MRRPYCTQCAITHHDEANDELCILQSQALVYELMARGSLDEHLAAKVMSLNNQVIELPLILTSESHEGCVVTRVKTTPAHLHLIASHINHPLMLPLQGTATALAWHTRIKIAAQTACALAYLHSNGINHRDIKVWQRKSTESHR